LKRLGLTFGGEDGQAVILVVVAMSILLIGALGLAIDGGQMYAQRQMAQAAADAAAQAGMMSIYDGTNATSAHPFGTGTPPIASSACTTTDGRTPCVYARNNGFGGTTADTVTLSFPATVSGVTLSSGNVPAFAVTVQRTLKTGLIRFLGAASTVTITARGTVGLVGAVSPYCIMALDPSAENAFLVQNGTTVTLNGCGVAVNSNNSQAALIYTHAVVAPEMDVVGGFPGCGAPTICPTIVKTGVPTIADPLASLPALTPGACVTPNPPIAVGGILNYTPGTYCGGITLPNGVTATFAAGNYIMDGGGIYFHQGVASGSGVMFYLTSDTTHPYGPLTVDNYYNSSSVPLTLSAPTSGPYLGVLFYQNRSITASVASANPNSIAGGNYMTLTGTLYFPTTGVSFSNGNLAMTMAVVADTVSYLGGDQNTVLDDPTGLKTGLFSKGVALVQ
jgi:Flp pilus assembly protein TadG